MEKKSKKIQDSNHKEFTLGSGSTKQEVKVVPNQQEKD